MTEQNLEQTITSDFSNYEPGGISFPGKETAAPVTDTQPAATGGNADVEVQPSSTQTSAAADTGVTSEQKTGEAATATIDAPDYGNWLKEKTNGLVGDPETLASIIEERNRLLEETKKPVEPKFENERMRKAYEFLIENQYEFTDSFQQYRHIMGIDVEKMNDKDIQKNAFILKNPDLGEDAAKMFDLQYDKKIAALNDEDTDDNERELARILQKRDTIEAKKYLGELQAKVKADAQKEVSPKDNTEYIQQVAKWSEDVNKAMSAFDKVDVSVGDIKVSLPVDKEDIKAVSEALNDPTSFWEKSISKSGESFNINDYRNNTAKIVLFDKFIKQSYDNGFAKGQIFVLDENKNIDKTRTTTVAPEGEKEQTFMSAWASAVKGKN